MVSPAKAILPVDAVDDFKDSAHPPTIQRDNQAEARAIESLGKDKATEWLQKHGDWEKVCRVLQENGIKDSNGCRTGQFKEGMLNGKGKWIKSYYCNAHRVNDITEGEFRADELHGEGKIMAHNSDGKLKYVKIGKFTKGQLDGKGTIHYYPPSYDRDAIVRIEGVFKDDIIQSGKITTADGIVKEGTCLEGHLSGPGTVTYPNGKIEQVEFEYNQILRVKKVEYISLKAAFGDYSPKIAAWALCGALVASFTKYLFFSQNCG